MRDGGMEPMIKRLFIGIPIKKEIREVLHRWCKELKSSFPFDKWIHPDDYHITLKYLGETDNTTIQQIKERLIQVAKSIEPFMVTLKDLGTFGPSHSPRILWTDVKGNTKELGALNQRIEEVMKEIGFAKEDRAYNPHLTLARRYKGESFQPDFLSKTNHPNEDLLQWEIVEMVLYESHLKRVPMYEAVEQFTFKT
jgi:2'-5' RNA ligase